GELLSEAFEAQGVGVVSRVYTTTLLAGERSGNLEEVLNRYIGYQRVTATFRKKLLASLWYPALLVCALTVMLSFLITYVVPRFPQYYSNFDAASPAMTKTLLAIGTGLQSYLYIIAPAIMIVILVTIAWVKSEQGGRMMDALRFKLPIFGEIWMKYQV